MKKKIITITFITLFSIGLWASVSLSGEYFTSITIPVNIVDLPGSYTVSNISPKEITLTIKAQGWEISKLTLGRKIQFDISAESKAGSHKVLVKNFVNNNSWISSTIQVIEIVPHEITFSVEKLRSKKVVIVPRLDLHFKQGYDRTSNIFVEPDTTVIFGAESIVKNIDTVKTVFKLIDEIEEPFLQEIPLQNIEGITYKAKNCAVKFDVQKIADKTFDDIPVEVINVPRGKELTLYPSKISIVLRGGLNLLGKMSNDDLKPFVDFWTAYKDESGTVEPKLKIPEYTKLIAKIPSKLQYVIKQL